MTPPTAAATSAIAIPSYRGELAFNHSSAGSGRFSLRRLTAMTPLGAAEDVGKALEEGHKHFYLRAYRQALQRYRDAERLAGSLPESNPVRMKVRLCLADAHYELHAFAKAEMELVALSRQRLPKIGEEPISSTLLWVKLAKVYLGEADALYRTGSTNLSDDRIIALRSKYDRILVGGLNPNPASPLYQNTLDQMRPDIQKIVLSIDEQTVDVRGIHAEIVALIYDTRRRFEQLKSKLNFIGYDQNYTPILSFRHLRDVARTFAQIAAQANREYVAYVRKIDEDTFTMRQLEQAVEVNRAGAEINRSATEVARREEDAAKAAEELAELRRRQAESYRDEYQRVGYENVLLDEALAWAQANSVHSSEQIKLQYEGLEHLGIAPRYQPRSHLIQELTLARARRDYALQRQRLQDQVAELAQARRAAEAQKRVATARTTMAMLSERAAAQRLRHSEENLELMRTREFGVEFFSYMTGLVRETARIYLDHATLIAFMMERAFRFETGADIRRIRFDYGDLDGAEGVYAADLLLRDIDYFAYQQIVGAQSKIQPAIRTISLAQDYPLEFLLLLRTGRMRFGTLLKDFQREHPGIYNARIANVTVRPIGLIGAKGPIGRLTVAGHSKFRSRTGAVVDKVHVSESLLLSSYNVRTDKLVAPTPPEQLGIFEHVGLETDWLLEIPQERNSFDIHRMTEVIVTFAYLCEVDADLARQDEAKVEPEEKAETRFSLKQDFVPDAFYTLEATARLDFLIDSARVPRGHLEPKLLGLRLLALGQDGKAVPLKVGLWSKEHGAQSDRYASGAHGLVVFLDEVRTGGWRDKPLLSQWSLTIPPEDNPRIAASAGGLRLLNLSSVQDLFLVATYRYRTR